ncbi:MAG: M24 family metallopeptidase, partial [Oscillospiraceae bacterium]|nr:M24 family metallopeptidase [Oscillospiraceae bacterium]
RVLTDRNTISRQMRCAFGEDVHVTEETSPAALLKAVKTETERENIRKAHIKDGIAVTKFIYWLKKTVPERTVTELEAAARLEAFRAEQADYLGPSFAPIVAYGYHGAIVHYEPTADSDIPMEPRGFCLTDTGGHYLQGTTDITRTIPLGPLTDEEKRAYTLAMRGHLRLAAAVFPEGVSGADLDCLARGPLWDQELDYDHGTGHGVGYILSVHESPPTISWRGRARQTPLKEGMLVSDEPGLYVEGKFGVRHENLLMCRREGDRFLRFEPMTVVPFDRDALDISLLEPRELQALNDYHARVYEKIAPGLDETERAWLAKATAPL